MKLPKSININIKNILTEENRTKAIGLLFILFVLWFILYFIPEIFSSLFNTILGNLILLLVSILSLSYNIKYGIITTLSIIILYRFSQLSKTKESFTWDPTSKQDFLIIQDTINRNTIFDVDMIEKNQASQEEVDYFIENGKWPWSETTIQKFEDAVKKNPFVKVYIDDASDYARTKYNEAAILQILYYQSNEGQFLLNGIQVTNPTRNKSNDMASGKGDFAYNYGLLKDNNNDTIKCNLDNSTLEKTTTSYNGKNTPLDFNNLENIIPGFSFTNGPCNPCSNINDELNRPCSFKINI
jgi:hypothetical protein